MLSCCNAVPWSILTGGCSTSNGSYESAVPCFPRRRTQCPTQYRFSSFRTCTTRNRQRSSLGLVVRAEEMFDVVENVLRQIVNVANDRLVDRRLDRSNEPIVTDRRSALLLCRADDPHETNVNQAAYNERRLGQDQNVESVAVLGACPGNRAEVEREGHACRQDAAELEHSKIGVELVFIPAAA